ncbi:hypothetical protein DN389_05515 [Bacillus sp. AY3-1]|uniref:hypothetical protein n=1 Tax=Bacillus cereus group TaxID=86661 RepID=UPI000BF597C3|nr:MULTISPECIES: hypothetical protein [Bacillus cereus group]KAA0747491.1 hypothetical protein DN389_05515 [Bacillus sp. AY3-1]PGE31844.1 hypothetical protein COM52_15335 [Bacillus wiedmannii]
MVAIIGGIVSGLVVYLIPKVAGLVFKLGKNSIVKLKKKIRYYRGHISLSEYLALKKKSPEKMSTIEKKILEKADRRFMERLNKNAEREVE